MERLFSLSAIVPTHGGRTSVRATVDALLAEASRRLEVIVVCDGEPAVARAALASINDDRLRIVAQQQNGPSAARNLGLSLARHEWVVFVDDDDLPRSHWFAVWASSAQESDAVVTACLRRWQVDGRLSERHCCVLDQGDPTMKASTLLAGAFIVRRDVLTAIGGYDPQLRFSENQDLGLRLLKHLSNGGMHDAVRRVEEVVIDVFMETPTSRKARYGTNRSKAAKILQDRYPDRLVADPAHAASLHRIIAHSALEQGNMREFRSSALAAVRVEPTRWANWRFLLGALAPNLTRLVMNRRETAPKESQ